MMPEIIAHRGASYLAPENTLTAFRKAMEIGADGVEMDVQQTGDKKLVIHHDFLIDWHTDMRGQIYDMTMEELKALDFGSWKDVSYKDERIATLQEALALCREMEGTVVQLELKATIDNEMCIRDRCRVVPDGFGAERVTARQPVAPAGRSFQRVPLGREGRSGLVHRRAAHAEGLGQLLAGNVAAPGRGKCLQKCLTGTDSHGRMPPFVLYYFYCIIKIKFFAGF